MYMVGEMTVEDAAKGAAGNWRGFDCFYWERARDIDDPDSWAVLYTHYRDSDLLDTSNAETIAGVMSSFSEDDDPDVVFESHGHWAVGHVDGVPIRVFRDGEITEAFKTYHGLAERMADDPILDEEASSRKEHDATIENIGEAAWRLKREYELPEGWESAVFSWFWEHNQRAVENRDDREGYPEESDMRDAFVGLGFTPIEE